VQQRNQLVPCLPDTGIDPRLFMVGQQKAQPVSCSEIRGAPVEGVEITHHGTFNSEAALGFLEIDQPYIQVAVDLSNEDMLWQESVLLDSMPMHVACNIRQAMYVFVPDMPFRPAFPNPLRHALLERDIAGQFAGNQNRTSLTIHHPLRKIQHIKRWHTTSLQHLQVL